jgi:hypothetical protein
MHPVQIQGLQSDQLVFHRIVQFSVDARTVVITWLHAHLQPTGVILYSTKIVGKAASSRTDIRLAAENGTAAKVFAASCLAIRN